MASGSGILGNQTSRSYAVWDNGWRPLKPETHLKIDGCLLYATSRYFAIVVVIGNVTQCRRRWMNEGTVNCGVALRPRPAEVQLRIYGYYIVFYFYII